MFTPISTFKSVQVFAVSLCTYLHGSVFEASFKEACLNVKPMRDLLPVPSYYGTHARTKATKMKHRYSLNIYGKWELVSHHASLNQFSTFYTMVKL